MRKYIGLCVEIRSIGAYGRSNWIKARELIEEAGVLYNDFTDAQKTQVEIWYPEILYDNADMRMMGDGNPIAAIEMLEECEQLFDKIGHIRDLGFVRVQLTFNNFISGDIDKSLEDLHSCLTYAEINNLGLLKVYVLGFQCEIYAAIGEITKSIETGEEAKQIANREKLNFTVVATWARRNLAIAYSLNGEYEEAKTEFTEVLQISDELQELHVYGSTLFHFGDVERKLGDLDIAIERFKHSAEILEKIKDLNCLINVNLRLGKALMIKNDYLGALEPLTKAFQIRGWKQVDGEETPLNLMSYSETLLELIIVSDVLNDDDGTRKYMGYLEAFASTYNSEKYKFQLELAIALIEMKKKRAKYKNQAQNRLESLVYNEVNEDELQIRAIINYCELLLEELQNYGEEEVLQEILDLTERISEIGERQRSYPMMVDGLILEGQLRLIQGDAQISIDKFNEAKEMAVKYKLKHYQKRAESQIEFLESEMEKWETIYLKNISLIERMEKTKILDYVNEAIKMRDFLPE